MTRSHQRQLSFAAKPKPLGVSQVLETLRSIAKMEGNKSQDKKVQAIVKLLRDASKVEARCVVRSSLHAAGIPHGTGALSLFWLLSSAAL